MDCLLFYLAGLLQDILLTSYQRCITVNFRWRASFLSASIAVISVMVISRIMSQMLNDHFSWTLIAYAAGKITGTYTSLRFLKFTQKPSRETHFKEDGS